MFPYVPRGSEQERFTDKLKYLETFFSTLKFTLVRSQIATIKFGKSMFVLIAAVITERCGWISCFGNFLLVAPQNQGWGGVGLWGHY